MGCNRGWPTTLARGTVYPILQKPLRWEKSSKNALLFCSSVWCLNLLFFYCPKCINNKRAESYIGLSYAMRIGRSLHCQADICVAVAGKVEAVFVNKRIQHCFNCSRVAYPCCCFRFIVT